jgi:hypothetical protein
MVTYMSYDFEHWTDATALSFERKGGDIPLPFRGIAGEQVHVGASLWNRGNVILGFYGMWHGHPSDDRRMVTMDLGLVVSHDALHFKEPVPDFRIIAANEEGEIVTHTYFPRLGDAGVNSLPNFPPCSQLKIPPSGFDLYAAPHAGTTIKACTCDGSLRAWGGAEAGGREGESRSPSPRPEPRLGWSGGMKQ